jgi:hypothetical protein
LIRFQLSAAQRRSAPVTSARPHRNANNALDAQRVVVIHIFVAERQAKHALLD